MRTIQSMLKMSLLAGAGLLSTIGVAQAQNTVSLTATRQIALMPDGTSVPMWGWLCGTGTAATAGGTGGAAAVGATCTQTNGNAQTLGTTAISTVWQPPLIRVPLAAAGTNTGLTITLTNTLPVASSLVIYGQTPFSTDVNNLGAPVRETGRPQHPTQTATTWTQVLTNQTPFTPPQPPER
jgi:hypothetical protein